MSRVLVRWMELMGTEASAATVGGGQDGDDGQRWEGGGRQQPGAEAVGGSGSAIEPPALLSSAAVCCSIRPFGPSHSGRAWATHGQMGEERGLAASGPEVARLPPPARSAQPQPNWSTAQHHQQHRAPPAQHRLATLCVDTAQPDSSRLSEWASLSRSAQTAGASATALRVSCTGRGGGGRVSVGPAQCSQWPLTCCYLFSSFVVHLHAADFELSRSVAAVAHLLSPSLLPLRPPDCCILPTLLWLTPHPAWHKRTLCGPPWPSAHSAPRRGASRPLPRRPSSSAPPLSQS